MKRQRTSKASPSGIEPDPPASNTGSRIHRVEESWKREVSNPTPRGRALLSRRAWLPANFSSSSRMVEAEMAETAEKRGLDPHTPEGAHCFRNRLGSQPISPPDGGPLRYRSGLSAFSEQRYHLISLRAVLTSWRKAEDSNLRRLSAVRIVFQTISAPRGFASLANGIRKKKNRRPSFSSWARTRKRARRVHAERDVIRARSPQYGCQSSGRSPSSRRIGGTTGRESGLKGLRSSFIPASSGVRLPLRSLHA